jgi:microcystin-dependent protein
MATYEATKYDFDGAAITGIQGLSTGTIIPWSTGTAPTGYLPCDGAAVSRTTYSALFAVIGTSYGSGDGSSTFNVPDSQDKNIKSVSNNSNVGTTGGANTVSPNSGNLANHTITTSQMGNHTHSVGSIGDNADYTLNSGNGNRARRTSANRNSSSTGNGGAHSHTLNGGDAVTVLQPYIALNFIIKT